MSMANLDALENELASVQASLDHYERTYDEFTDLKRTIETEISQRNVIGQNGLRMGVIEREKG